MKGTVAIIGLLVLGAYAWNQKAKTLPVAELPPSPPPTASRPPSKWRLGAVLNLGGFRGTVESVEWNASRQTYIYTLSAINLQLNLPTPNPIVISEADLAAAYRRFNPGATMGNQLAGANSSRAGLRALGVQCG